MLKGLKQAVGLGEAAAAATTVPTVTPPVKTVATALTAKLAALNADRPLEAGRSADDWAALSAALKEGGCTSCPDDLRSLQDAVESPNSPSADAFWGELVPFACAQAQRFEELFTEPIAIVDADAGGVGGVSRVVEWTQAQCLCIQCNAFLCSWPERTSSNCGCTERDARALGLPSINLDEMHCGAGNRVPQAAKCEMFLHYLAKQKRRIEGGDALTRKVRFVRRKIEKPGGGGGGGGGAAGGGAVADAAGVRPEPDWASSTVPLKRVTVRALGESIDEAKDMLRADFANESIGGGSIAYGCVQEEIMFACHPELNCARLVFTPMQPDEAFVLCGAEQFAQPAGYAFDLGCAGPYEDTTGVSDGGDLKAFVTAIDAMDYRWQTDTSQQYQRDCVERELLKAFAGFALPPEVTQVVNCTPPTTLATGNWGAGAFRGDGQVKALVQWAAASEAGLDMCYFPFDDETIAAELQPTTEAAMAKGLTVGHLAAFILRDLGTLRPQGNWPSGAGVLDLFRQWVADEKYQ